MLVLAAAVLALATVPIAGGRLRALATAPLAGWPLLLAAGGLQGAVAAAPASTPGWATWAGHVASYGCAGGLLWVNRRLPGVPLVALGGAGNAVPIGLNGGTLPADPDALARAGLPPGGGGSTNSGVVTDPVLAPLGDVFAVPAGWPLANVFSVGDVLLVLGVAYGAHRLCGSRVLPPRARHRRPIGARRARAAARSLS